MQYAMKFEDEHKGANDRQKLADISFPGYRRGHVTGLKIFVNMWLEGMVFLFTDRV